MGIWVGGAAQDLLDSPEAGTVRQPGEEAWETKLAALRSRRRARANGSRARPGRARCRIQPRLCDPIQAGHAAWA